VVPRDEKTMKEIDFLFLPATLEEFLLCVDSSEKIIENHKSANIKIFAKKFVYFKKLDEKIQIINGFVPQGYYTKTLHESRAVVLPYRSKFHEYGTSGKLLDALISGCFVVVPDSSAMSAYRFRYPQIIPYEDNVDNNIHLNSILLSLCENQSAPNSNHQVSQMNDLVEFLAKVTINSKPAGKLHNQKLLLRFWSISVLYFMHQSKNESRSHAIKRFLIPKVIQFHESPFGRIFPATKFKIIKKRVIEYLYK
jgi:hypothetical protein